MAAGSIDPPQLPARLAERYVLEQRLADGGSAEVWLARDSILDRPVAIKVLHRHLLSDATMRARLEQEARAAAGLSHPGIVGVHDVEVDESAAAVVLEFVEGEPLDVRLRRDGPLPPAEAARIAAEIAEALAHAHERGVIHRDVKPANVLIEPDGRARLVDFGIARVMEDAESQLTATGTITGTLRYLAPEQLRGEPAGPLADVYGVGVILAEMLTGRPPYEAANPVALAEAQRTPPPPIEGAPPELADLVGRCLDPDPNRRPASADALANELRAWLANFVDPDDLTSTYAVVGVAAAPEVEALAATEASPTSPTIQAVPVVPAEPAAVVTPAGPRRGVPWAAWPLAAALLGLALVLLVVASPFGSSPVSGPSGGPSPTTARTAAPAATEAAPAATNAPPARPTTVAGAVAAFNDRVDAAVKAGAIRRKDADDLSRRADEIAKKADDPKRDDISKRIDDLRKKIDDFERTRKIDSAKVADDLRAAVDDIEAATEG